MKAAQSTITDYNLIHVHGLTNVNPGSNVKIDVIVMFDLEQK